jgi:ABC-type multidrug transport system fused ATPase/permease subunit
MEGRTTLIAHRLSTVREADQIVVLDEGRWWSRSHDDLVAYGGVYAHLVAVQGCDSPPLVAAGCSVIAPDLISRR